MFDNWEDWDNEEPLVPVLDIHKKEELKRLEERKLIEESDNALTNDLFTSNSSNNSSNNSNNSNNIININNSINNSTDTKNIKKKFISKKKENELKQKEFSEKLKKKKEDDKRHAETFGEYSYDDEYAHYEYNL